MMLASWETKATARSIETVMKTVMWSIPDGALFKRAVVCVDLFR
jgi:hypothetical protein